MDIRKPVVSGSRGRTSVAPIGNGNGLKGPQLTEELAHLGRRKYSTKLYQSKDLLALIQAKKPVLNLGNFLVAVVHLLHQYEKMETDDCGALRYLDLAGVLMLIIESDVVS